MSEARAVSRNLLTVAFVSEWLPGPRLAAGAPSMTEPMGDLDLMECLEVRYQMALRLACIGDEIDLRFRGTRLAQLPGMAMHSLALTYSQAGVRGVLRSLTHSLTNLRDSIWSWRPAAPRSWVPPAQACRQLLLVLLVALLLSGALHLLLQ